MLIDKLGVALYIYNIRTRQYARACYINITFVTKELTIFDSIKGMTSAVDKAC